MAEKRKWNLTEKWNMGKAKKLTIFDIQSMTLPEKADLAQYYYTMFRRRVNEASRAGIMPFAIRKMFRDFNETYSTEIDINGEKMAIGDYLGFNLSTPITRYKSGKYELNPIFDKLPYVNNTLVGYINMMQDFFSWETSTVAGWKKFARNQDIRLFGADKKGNPNHSLTDLERDAFWKAYNELKTRGTTMLLDSESIINTGYSMLWMDKKFTDSINIHDITSIVRRLEEIWNKQELEFPEIIGGDENNPFEQRDVFGREFSF